MFLRELFKLAPFKGESHFEAQIAYSVKERESHRVEGGPIYRVK